MTNLVNIPTDSGADVENVSAAVSQRIKSLRKDSGLSLDELSKRSGVSKGMLVEIEKGGANPSIAILCKVAAAFGISVADIVSVAESAAARLIMPEEVPTLWEGPEGGTARLLAGTSGPDMIELWRWVMRPGESYETEGHPRGTLELLHVESGKLTLSVNESTLVVPESHSAVARTDAPHRYANEEPCELLFTMTVFEPHRPRTS